jgi:type IX secretion system PorP/SprF family membrane protein
MIRIKYIASIILFVCSVSTNRLLAQLPSLYASFGFNSLPLNPAVAGYHDNLTATLSNRSSFNQVVGAPSTQFFSFHSSIGKKGWVGGLEVINDKAGLIRNMQFSGIGGYKIDMKESSLTAAIKAGYAMNNLLWSQSTTSTLNDPTIYGDENVSEVLAGCGLFYRDPRTSLGVSQSTQKDMNLTTRGWIVHGSYLFGSKRSWYWQPAFALRYSSTFDMMADMNVTVNHDKFGSLGFSMRSNQSLAIYTRIVFTQQIWATVSYDFFTKPVPGAFHNTMEISLHYDLIRKSSTPNPLIF